MTIIAAFSRRASRRCFDFDAAIIIAAASGALQRILELGSGGARYLEEGFVRANPDRADFILGNVPATADQRQNPARIGVLSPTDRHFEPHGILKTRTVAIGAAHWLL